MRVASIDVGIRNLAVGVFEKSPFTIHFWKNLDIQCDSENKCLFMLTRGTRKGQPCGQAPQGTLCYCSSHAKKVYTWPRTCTGTTKKGLSCRQKVTWHEPIEKIFACSHHKSDSFLLISDKQKKKVDYHTMCSALVKTLDRYADELLTVDKVLIEYQPSIAMRKVQGCSYMLLTYFVMKGIKSVIFVPAQNKLLSVSKDRFDQFLLGKATADTTKQKRKKDYKFRKETVKDNCEDLLYNKLDQDDIKTYQQIWNQSRKKDDLADSLLMAYWWIHHHR